ncbi:hypothetical protein PSTT_07055, partial [Puccinia striiformis]
MAISPNEERSVSPEPKPERMQNEQQERPASVQEEHQNGSHRDSDPDDRQPSPHSREGEGEPIDNKNGLKEQEEGDHQSTTNDDHKSRSRREKDSRVHHHHRSDDRSRIAKRIILLVAAMVEDIDLCVAIEKEILRRANELNDQSLFPPTKSFSPLMGHACLPTNYSFFRKPVDRSPGKDSDIRSHSSRPIGVENALRISHVLLLAIWIVGRTNVRGDSIKLKATIDVAVRIEGVLVIAPTSQLDHPHGGPQVLKHEMRSVFVSQLSARVGDRELFQFFEQQAGKVRDARLITDRISRRSKGVGYVEFRELDSVQKALSLTGTKLLGLPVMVQYTEAEKNRQAMANTQPNVPPGFVPTNLNSTNPTANATNSTMVATPLVPRTYVTPKARGPGPNDPNSYARLYVGSLNFNLTDDDIRQVFNHLVISNTSIYIVIKSLLDGALRVEIKAQPPAALLNATAPGVANPVMVTPTGGNFAVNVATVVPPSNNFEERLEEPMGGNLNQISRVELMHKLARTEQPTNIPVTDMFRPNIPTATSRSVLLKNMFNPEEETEQGWDVELRDDVKGECEEKYGPVLAIAIEKESSAGDIYITFDSVPSAQKAITGLNNRWFGGRQITAAFISDALVAAHGGK